MFKVCLNQDRKMSNLSDETRRILETHKVPKITRRKGRKGKVKIPLETSA